MKVKCLEMQYSQRDICVAGMLGLIPAGFGAAVVVIGTMQSATVSAASKADTATFTQVSCKPSLTQPERSLANTAGLTKFGCLVLDDEVQLQIRQLQKTGGCESADETAMSERTRS